MDSFITKPVSAFGREMLCTRGRPTATTRLVLGKALNVLLWHAVENGEDVLLEDGLAAYFVRAREDGLDVLRPRDKEDWRREEVEFGKAGIFQDFPA